MKTLPSGGHAAPVQCPDTRTPTGCRSCETGRLAVPRTRGAVRRLTASWIFLLMIEPHRGRRSCGVVCGLEAVCRSVRVPFGFVLGPRSLICSLLRFPCTHPSGTSCHTFRRNGFSDRWGIPLRTLKTWFAPSTCRTIFSCCLVLVQPQEVK